MGVGGDELPSWWSRAERRRAPYPQLLWKRGELIGRLSPVGVGFVWRLVS